MHYQNFIVMAAGVLLVLAAGAEKAGVSRWEAAIRAFEEKDKAEPPAKGGIVFVGSSSIRMWKLEKWFPGMPVLNRGFGGSSYADLVEFADRIVIPYAPSAIVVYSGDNDIAGGKKAEEVFGDFKRFVALVQKQLPKTRIIVISIKPSVARWKLFDEMRAANRLIREYAGKDERLIYIDSEAPMLGEDGTPRRDLLLEDGLHLNEQGYAIWTALVMPHLKPPASD